MAIIRSNLMVPSSYGLLHRPRVYEAIEEGLERKLTLVTAPAGYGKTSALVDFAQRSPVPVCWYTASEHDRDLGLLIQYLIAATAERFSGFGEHIQETLISQGRERLRDLSTVVGELANEMLDLDTPFVLVLDNFEVLEGAFGIRKFVHRLLEVLPLNCHLMLGSRVVPDVPITHLIAEQQFVGLTEQDLRFEPLEIQKLLHSSGIEVSKGWAETLATKTEGWITGVLLMADRLRDEVQAALLDGEKTSVQMYDYLAEEVVSRQPPKVQHFLRISAVLREMSPLTCREILQIESPRALLAKVERRNLFVTRVGKGAAATYRYHNLFREFLHEQLRWNQPARCVELHLRAAEWFEQRGDVDTAVHHYMAAEAWSKAASRMERVVGEWFTRGRVETLLHWAEILPDEVKEQIPRLLLYQSMVLIDRHDYKRAQQVLTQARNGLLVQKDLTSLAWVHNQWATLALFEGRYQKAISEAEAALEALGPNEAMWQAQAQRLIGKAYVGMGHLAEGQTWLESALTSYRQSESLYDIVNLLLDLSHALSSQGRLDEALMRLSEALPMCRKIGAPVLLAGVLNNLGWNCYLRGEHRQALALYQEGITVARRENDLWHQAYISVGIADIYRDVGAYEQAELLYDVGWQIAKENRPTLAVYIMEARGSMYRWRGEHTGSLAVLKRARQLAEEKGLHFEVRGLLTMAEGIALAESGNVEVGLRLLSNAVDFLAQQQARRDLARAYLLLAKARLLADDELRAVADLRQAIVLAEESNTYQFIIAESQYAGELIELGIAKGVAGCQMITEGIQRSRAFRKELVQDGTEPREDVGVRLEIFALGGGMVIRDKQMVTLSEWQAAKARELFFYILLHGPLERNTIGQTFWPSWPTERMASSLYSMIYRIRRAVGVDAIVFEKGKYRFGDVDYWFDVTEFEALVEQARSLKSHDWQVEQLWQQAVARYRGDFLPEVGQIWCVAKREALRQMYIEALIGIGRCCEAQDRFEAAVSWYQRAVEVEVTREDVHLRIMRCYAKAGFRSEALAQYNHYRKILTQELNAEPSDEMRRIHRKIIEDKSF